MFNAKYEVIPQRFGLPKLRVTGTIFKDGPGPFIKSDGEVKVARAECELRDGGIAFTLELTQREKR